jgi:hypothetical protein
MLHNHKLLSAAALAAAMMMLATTCSGSHGAELFGPMKGLFWMVGSTDREGKDAILRSMDQVLSRNEHLSGVFLGVHWKDIEPQPGKYDWEFLDAQIARARKYKKMYKLSIFPGTSTPAWVYEQGCEAFSTVVTNPHRPNVGEEVKIPVPWDEVYQKCYLRLLGKLAERYGNDKHFVAVALGGANFMSDEMHLPKRKEDVQKWGRYGDYRSKLVAVYKKLIDSYAATFPHQQVCLHVSMPIQGMENEVSAIVAYGAQKHPEQFTLQSCQLNGRSENNEVFSYRIIMQNRDRVRHGFQNVAGWRYSGERQGSMEMTVLNLVHADSEYWELWRGDGASRETCAKLQQLWDTAKKLGYDGYKRELQQQDKYRER